MSQRPTSESINEALAKVLVDAGVLDTVQRAARAAVDYDVELANGIAVNICVALCDISATDSLADFARNGGASEYGLISVSGLSNAPEKPILWEFMEADGQSGVGFTAADGEPDLSAEVYGLCARTLFRFFEDIPVVAPLLSAKARELTDAYELGQMVEIDQSKLH